MASNYFNLRRFNLTTTFKDISFSALMALYGSARRNLNQASLTAYTTFMAFHLVVLSCSAQIMSLQH
jgi:hypothetical protein